MNLSNISKEGIMKRFKKIYTLLLISFIPISYVYSNYEYIDFDTQSEFLTLKNEVTFDNIEDSNKDKAIISEFLEILVQSEGQQVKIINLSSKNIGIHVINFLTQEFESKNISKNRII